jgi:hypothetical protein
MANGKWQMANGFSFVILQLSNRKPFEFCLLPFAFCLALASDEQVKRQSAKG